MNEELIKMSRHDSHRTEQNSNNSQQKTNLEDTTSISIEPNVNTEEESYNQIQELKDINGKVISDKSTKINVLEYTNLLDNWMNFTNNMNMQILENSEKYKNNYKRVYNNWWNLSFAIITDFRGNLQLFSLIGTRSLYSEIGDLKDKIKQLENRLNKLEKR